MHTQLASVIEHTCLKPEAQTQHIRQLCNEAQQWKMAGVCVSPYYVEIANHFLNTADIKLVTVVGFPLGTTLTSVKQKETNQCINLGADEIDMVLQIGAMQEQNFAVVENDIRSVVREAGNHPVKVILETCYLIPEQIVTASKISEQAGASFVKTSTGFGSSGATVENVRLMKEAVGSRLGIKASGGIRTYDQCQALIEAGATRLGMSASVSILSDF